MTPSSLKFHDALNFMLCYLLVITVIYYIIIWSFLFYTAFIYGNFSNEINIVKFSWKTGKILWIMEIISESFV